MVAVLREFRPHVVVTYDPNGGYGHPDHIQAHRIATAAVAASADDQHPGDPWRVPKFYWNVMSRDALIEGLRALEDIELPDGWIRLPADGLPFEFGYPADAVIDAPGAVTAKVNAMRAHRTQVTVEPSGRVFALSNNIALPITGTEHYVLAAGERGADGVETDLLAGLDVDLPGRARE